MRYKRGLCLALLHICEDEHQEAIEVLGVDPYQIPRGACTTTESDKEVWDRGVRAAAHADQLRRILKDIDEQAKKDQQAER